jgi:hypothetical protein
LLVDGPVNLGSHDLLELQDGHVSADRQRALVDGDVEGDIMFGYRLLIDWLIG